MKSQIVLPKNFSERIITEYEQFIFKKPLKAKNFTFPRTWSLKLQKTTTKTRSPSNQERKESSEQRNFVPRLKSKQLLKQPKFFFSLERKKLKNQRSDPCFNQIKTPNPEMKGSKTKGFYTKIQFGRKQSSKEIKEIERFCFSPKKRLNEKITTSESQALRTNEIFEQQLKNKNLFCVSPNEKESGIKPSKRPNLQENISFLIRRQRENKNKITLNKINFSKHTMEELLKSQEEEIF